MPTRRQRQRELKREWYLGRKERVKAACNKLSKQRYHTDPEFRETKKASSRDSSKAEYEANPDAKKAKSRARSKAEYQADPDAKKTLSRRAYLNAVKRARKNALFRAYYSKTREAILMYR